MNMSSNTPSPSDPTVRLPQSSDETLTLRDEGAAQKATTSLADGALVADGLYRIECELARGGMGVVHKAIDQSSKRSVVIKSLLPDVARDEDYKKRFLREAMEWVNLGAHPYIVRAYTAHEIDYSPRIIAEFVEGGSLSEYLKKQHLLPEDAFRLAAQICWGMDYAHQKGLAHRDLKPGNILLDAKGNAKVTDFGLVKQIADDQSETKVLVKGGHQAFDGSLMTFGVIGTPEYIAPEQWNGKGGKESDIYAFGVMLYELFCGRRPFEHGNLDGMSRISAYYKSHTQDAPPKPQAIARDIPGVKQLPTGLQELMLQCLAKDPHKRPGTFREIANQLNAIAQNQLGHAASEEPTAAELDHQSKLDQAYGLLRLGQGSMFHMDAHEAVKFSQQAENLFIQLGLSEQALDCLALRANVYISGNRIREAWEVVSEWKRRIGDSNSGVHRAELNNVQARLYLHEGRIVESHQLYVQACAYWESVGDSENIAILNGNLGNLLARAGQFEEAERRLHNAYSYWLNRNDDSHLVAVISNLSMVYYYLRKYDNAGRCFNEMGVLAEQTGRPQTLSMSYYGQGLLEFQKNNFEKAVQLFEKSLVLRRQLNMTFECGYSLLRISMCYSRMKQFENSQRCLDEASKVLRDSPWGSHALQAEAEYHSQRGNLDKAITLTMEAIAAAKKQHYYTGELEILLGSLQERKHKQ